MQGAWSLCKNGRGLEVGRGNSLASQTLYPKSEGKGAGQTPITLHIDAVKIVTGMRSNYVITGFGQCAGKKTKQTTTSSTQRTSLAACVGSSCQAITGAAWPRMCHIKCQSPIAITMS